jgi:hypothetical protein
MLGEIGVKAGVETRDARRRKFLAMGARGLAA